MFDAINRHLCKHGYIARGGQMIDASIMQAPRQSLSKEEKAIVSEGAMPAELPLTLTILRSAWFVPNFGVRP